MSMNEHSASTNASTELAKERSSEAADRTLMAWIRTSLAMIGFGFGIAKISHYLKAAEPGRIFDPIHSARIFGGAFIALGTLGLLGAVIQHWQILKRIERQDFIFAPPWPLTEVVATILLFVGFFAFIAILF